MIQFTQDLPAGKLLMAYNNNVVRLYSDIPKTALKCEITGMGLDVHLQPGPDGSFYFNFREYFGTLVNTQRFADVLATNLISADPDTFTYDVSDGCYLAGEITFKVTFLDSTDESTTRNVAMLAGVFQLEDYKRNQIPDTSTFAVLSPVADRSNNTVNLKYWEGYPFELSFFSAQTDPVTLKNTTTGEQYDFAPKGAVTALVLSDGRTDVTLEDFLPMITGHNSLSIFIGEADQNINLNIEKADSDCGVYIKWLNKFGRFNYWLLNHRSSRDRVTKYGEEVYNDFENLEHTTSPTLQMGKTSGDTLKCNSKKLTEDENVVFSGLFDSPKVYLFTGERFSQSDLEDWVEVTLKNTSFKVEDSGRRAYNYNVDLELPTRYAQSL
jgi:hypothetical protein